MQANDLTHPEYSLVMGCLLDCGKQPGGFFSVSISQVAFFTGVARYRDLLTIPADPSEVVPSTPTKQLQIPKSVRQKAGPKESRKDSLLRLFSDIGGEGTRSQINERIPDYWELRPEEL